MPGEEERTPMREIGDICYSSLSEHFLEDHQVCHSFVPLRVGAVVRPQLQA